MIIEDPPHGPYTPLSLACRKERDEVIDLLLSNGAVPDQKCLDYVLAWEDADEELVKIFRSKMKVSRGSFEKARPSKAGQPQAFLDTS